MKKIIFWSLCVFALVACSIKIKSVINFSDLFSDTDKTIIASLKVSVAGCDDIDSQIQEIQTELKKRNVNAHYNNCENAVWDSYANFSVPFAIVKHDGAPDANKVQDYIYFVYQDNTLSVRTSQNMASTLKSSMDSFYGDINISAIEFELTNDTTEEIEIKTDMVFIDEKPAYNKTVKIEPFSKIHIKLSDVATKLLENSNVTYDVFQVVNRASE